MERGSTMEDDGKRGNDQDGVSGDIYAYDVTRRLLGFCPKRVGLDPCMVPRLPLGSSHCLFCKREMGVSSGGE